MQGVQVPHFQYADLIGTPFKLGGRPGSGYLDCYGLVEELMRRAGQVVPDYLRPEVHEEIAARMELAIPFWIECGATPGAVAAIRLGRHVSHVGVVLPYGRMIHSWERAGGVAIERLSDWERRIVGYYKFPQ